MSKGAKEPVEEIENLCVVVQRVSEEEKSSCPWKMRGRGVRLFQFDKTGTGTKQRKVEGQKKMCTLRGLGAKLPIKGLSLVIGIISDTVFRNIVSERRIVTPENQSFISLPFDSIHT